MFDKPVEETHVEMVVIKGIKRKHPFWNEFCSLLGVHMEGVIQMKAMFKQDDGFSLVEVLFAVLITAVGLIGAIPLFLLSSQEITDAEVRTTAAFLANSLIDEMKSKPYNEVLDHVPADHPMSESGYLFTRTTDIDDGDNEATWEEDDAPVELNMKRISVVVSYPVPGGSTRSITITSYIFRH